MLSNDDKTRYAKKLDIIFKDSDAIEPFELSDKNWKDDVSLWPEFEQIYSYLIDTPGEYTNETLNPNKDLKAFNYYIYQVGIRSKLTMQKRFFLCSGGWVQTNVLL